MCTGDERQAWELGAALNDFRVPTATQFLCRHGNACPSVSPACRTGHISYMHQSGPPGTRTPNLWIKSPQLCH